MLDKPTFHYLVSYFFDSNKMNIVFIILLSFLINFLQINVLSKLTAQIISSLKENKIELVYSNYKFFLCISFIYIIVYALYKYLQGKFQTFITTTHPLEMVGQHVTLSPSAQQEEV